MTVSAQAGTTIPAAEYARRIGVSKSRMSEWFRRGLPFTEGKDFHGRDCKMVDPAVADDWRSVNLSLKVMSTGQVRGLVEGRSRPESTTPSRPRDDGGGEPAIAEAEAPAAVPAPVPSPGQPNTPPKKSAPPPALPPAGADDVARGGPTAAERIQESKAQEAEGAAKMRKLALQRAEGALVERAGAVRVQKSFVAKVAATLDRMPADMATVVADELKTTEHAAYTVLRTIAERLREDLARDADAAADAAGGKPVLLPG